MKGIYFNLEEVFHPPRRNRALRMVGEELRKLRSPLSAAKSKDLSNSRCTSHWSDSETFGKNASWKGLASCILRNVSNIATSKFE